MNDTVAKCESSSLQNKKGMHLVLLQPVTRGTNASCVQQLFSFPLDPIVEKTLKVVYFAEDGKLHAGSTGE